MTTTIITGDLHGRWEQARELFRRVGLIESSTDDPADDERQPGFHHIQLGDAVSLGYGEIEAGFFRWLMHVVGVDVPLLGNHELPAVWWHPNAVMFHGYHDRSEIAAEVDQDRPRGTGHYWAQQYPWDVGRDWNAEALVRQIASAGQYAIATSVGDWLVTHAGLASLHEQNHGLRDKSSAAVAQYLNELYRTCMETTRSSAVIDSRSEASGGVTWLRIDHLRNGYDNGSRRRPQIVGHSGYLGPKRFGERLWLIDGPTRDVGNGRTEGGAAALVTNDDGATFELEYVT